MQSALPINPFLPGPRQPGRLSRMSPWPLPSSPHGPRGRPIAGSGAVIAILQENPRRPRVGSTSELGSRSPDEPFSLFSPLRPPASPGPRCRRSCAPSRRQSRPHTRRPRDRGAAASRRAKISSMRPRRPTTTTALIPAESPGQRRGAQKGRDAAGKAGGCPRCVGAAGRAAGAGGPR